MREIKKSLLRAKHLILVTTETTNGSNLRLKLFGTPCHFDKY